MQLNCEVFDERWNDEDGSVSFQVRVGGDEKPGRISADAIKALQIPLNTDWATTFAQHRSRIQKLAHSHWRKNPLNPVIVIGVSDF